MTTLDKTFDTQPPLAGIRVIDFGHYFAGPLAGMLLADQGAEVVKIDRSGQRKTPTTDTDRNLLWVMSLRSV